MSDENYDNKLNFNNIQNNEKIFKKNGFQKVTF